MTGTNQSLSIRRKILRTNSSTYFIEFFKCTFYEYFMNFCAFGEMYFDSARIYS